MSQRVGRSTGNPDVDGVLSARYVQAAADAGTGRADHAEPRVVVWDVDFAARRPVRRRRRRSGLGGPEPGAGQIVVNRPLADSLHLRAGDTMTLYLEGVGRDADRRPHRARPGIGRRRPEHQREPQCVAVRRSSSPRPPVPPRRPRSVTFVSNRGGVQTGAHLTSAVTADIRATLGSLAGTALVDTPKKDVLAAAQQTGDTLGALFLMIGSFSIIAGALLLVNIFVMLGDERKSQLGMLRAIGMTRSSMAGSLSLEGAAYSLAAVVPGVLLGLGVGWAVASVAAEIFSTFSSTGSALTIRFAVTPDQPRQRRGARAVHRLVTIVATSVRISRFNVIAAIRDLRAPSTPRKRRLLRIVATACAVVLAVLAVPAVANSQAELSYLLPSLAAACLVPLMRKLVGTRAAVTGIAAAVLVWCLVLPVVRPHVFDQASMAVYVIEGTLLAFSGVTLVGANEELLLAPVRHTRTRPTDAGIALRLAVAYPLAKRFRTGATLVMYTLITLVLVLLVEIYRHHAGQHRHDGRLATAGYTLRVDVNAAEAAPTSRPALSRYSARDRAVVPLVSAPTLAQDPGHRTDALLHSYVVGVPRRCAGDDVHVVAAAGPGSDRAVWAVIEHDPRLRRARPLLRARRAGRAGASTPRRRVRLTDPADRPDRAEDHRRRAGPAADVLPDGAAAGFRCVPHRRQSGAGARTRAGVRDRRHGAAATTTGRCRRGRARHAAAGALSHVGAGRDAGRDTVRRLFAAEHRVLPADAGLPRARPAGRHHRAGRGHGASGARTAARRSACCVRSGCRRAAFEPRVPARERRRRAAGHPARQRARCR